jgi:hypothetical protein
MKAKLLFLAALLVVAFGVAYAWDDDDDTTMRFGPWMEPDLVPEVNSPDFMDSCVSISKDGLSLYFASNRPKGEGSRDLYVSERASTKKTWGTPRKLKILNTQYWDSCPALSLDEQQLYFASNRLGGCGGSDIYVSWRKDKRKNFGETGWGLPVNLGCEVDDYVNTSRTP